MPIEFTQTAGTDTATWELRVRPLGSDASVGQHPPWKAARLRRWTPRFALLVCDSEANADEAGAIISRMDEIGKDNWTAGFAGDASEFLKRAFGREDFITEVRKQYQDIKVRSAVQNLPPGVASDKDIELVLAPWPNDTSNFDLVRKKLEAIQRVEQGRAAYRLFESEWMASKGQRNGLQRAWLETNGAKQVTESNRNSELDKPYKVITE